MNKKFTLLAAGCFAGFFLSNLSAQIPCLQVQCLPAAQKICDDSGNDPELWHYIAWWDPATASNDLADVEVDLSVQVENPCAEPFSAAFELLLDLDGDGAPESSVRSDELDNFPAGYLPYNNYPDPAQLEYRLFDLRNVAPEANYRFALQTLTDGNRQTFRVAWNTEIAPDAYQTLQLPYGRHRIVWTLTEANGAQTNCSTGLDIADCKAPAVVCLNGLSVNIMPSGMTTLFASDFLQFASDNYTPFNRIQIGLRKKGDGTGFPTDSTGAPSTRLAFNCDELNANTVELWARDAAGNTDFCETTVLVQDNAGICSWVGGLPDTLMLCLQYCGASFPLDVNFQVDGMHPALPPLSWFVLPHLPNQHCRRYPLSMYPLLGNYTITPNKDNDQINGLSTYDLVRIERHILGHQALETPYKLIAADANNSRSITTFDIVELRKLLLGTYVELPNNTSWRFIPANYVFPNPDNPFATIFPETIQLNNTPGDSANFIGIKVGDVTCSATPEGLLPQRETLSLGKEFCLNLPKRNLGPGKTLTIPITAGTSGPLFGYQFALNIQPPLYLSGVLPGSGQSLDNFSFIGNVLTCSWSRGEPYFFKTGDTLFYLTLSASYWANTADRLSLKTDRLYPEAYNTMGMYKPIVLCFTGGGQLPGDPSQQIVVQPNPVVDRAWAPAPASGTVSWEVLDMAGRVLLRGSETLDGQERLELPTESLAAGIYLFRLWAGDTVQSGRMVKL